MEKKIYYYLGIDGSFHPVSKSHLTVETRTPTPPATPPPPSPKAKFNPGDVVTLNSGSPDMTVVDETNGDVRVIYFPETETAAFTGEPRHACFPAVCLSAIPTNEAMN